jgi:hypothetical protein
MKLLLTGQLPFVLLVATILALPISLGLLRMYRRAVVRSMRVTAAGGGVAGEASGPSPPAERRTGPRPPAASVEALLRGGPWRTATVYAVASCAYAVVMVAGVLLSTGLELFPVRVLFLLVSYAWPVVLTINLVAGTVPSVRSRVLGAYLAGLGLITLVAVVISPKFTIGQAIVFWLITNAPPTVAVWIVLARPVRAVGPLVLTFMVIAAAGANVALSVADADERVLRRVVVVGQAVGLNATGMFIGIIAVGAAVFAVGGWLALRWIGARYQQKRISDQSITLDAIWLFFGLAHSIGLAFEAPAWILTGPAAFLAFRFTARAGFAIALQRASVPGAGSRLLVLRVFALGRQSERLFARVTTHWRHAGSVHLIAGPDLAMTTVEPHEFLDFIHGRLARRFIDGDATFGRRLAEMDLGPDRDGRYRVNDFFCFDNAWRAVVSHLARSSDAVLVDLRGFSRQNAGVVFELNTLVDAVPLERVVMAVDDTTDAAFLEETIQKARSQMSAESPNRSGNGTSLATVRVQDRSLRELPLLLSALARAAHA